MTTYLGDGVSVHFDGYALGGALVLTTDDGIRITNRVVLEPEVYRALTNYVERQTTTQVKADSTPDPLTELDELVSEWGGNYGWNNDSRSAFVQSADALATALVRIRELRKMTGRL